MIQVRHRVEKAQCWIQGCSDIAGIDSKISVQLVSMDGAGFACTKQQDVYGFASAGQQGV